MFNVFHCPGSDWQEGGHLRQKEIEKVPLNGFTGDQCAELTLVVELTDL